MKKSFSITANNEVTSLDEFGMAEIEFEVTNVTNKVTRARINIIPEGDAQSRWFRLPNRRIRLAGNESTTVNVSVGLPEDCSPQQIKFSLGVVSMQNPEEDFAEGPIVRVDLKAKPAPKPAPAAAVRMPWFVFSMIFVWSCLIVYFCATINEAGVAISVFNNTRNTSSWGVNILEGIGWALSLAVFSGVVIYVANRQWRRERSKPLIPSAYVWRCLLVHWGIVIVCFLSVLIAFACSKYLFAILLYFGILILLARRDWISIFDKRVYFPDGRSRTSVMAMVITLLNLVPISILLGWWSAAIIEMGYLEKPPGSSVIVQQVIGSSILIFGIVATTILVSYFVNTTRFMGIWSRLDAIAAGLFLATLFNWLCLI